MPQVPTQARRGRKGGKREPYKFTLEKQQEYLELLAEGGRRHASAYKVGITPALVAHMRKTDAEFAAQMDLAERRANEAVESALYKVAKKGNVIACQVWLYNREPDRWKDARNRDKGENDGDSYHYHFYMPDNQRTNEPIVLNGNGHDPESVLQIPSNGHDAGDEPTQ